MVQFYKSPKAKSGKKSSSSRKANQSIKLSANKAAYELETLTIDTLDHHGNGIVLSTQPITVVEGALKGETVRAKIHFSSNTVRRAKVKQVIDASSDRIAPPCKIYGQCGGCSLQILSASDGLKYKTDALISYFLNSGKVSEQLWSAPITSNSGYDDVKLESSTKTTERKGTMGYRRKVRFAIDARNPKNVKVGYRQTQSSSVVNIDTCPILHPLLTQKVEKLFPLIKSLTCVQKLGHLECTLMNDGVLLLINLSKPLAGQDKKDLLSLSITATVRLACQLKGDIVFEVGEQYASLRIEDVKGIKLKLKPRHFLQVNSYVNAQMVEQALVWLAPTANSKVIDFFCGMGNFSVPLAQQCKELVGYEGVQEMVEQARINAHINDCENTQFQHLDLSDKQSLNSIDIAEGDLVLLDPSREGALHLCEMLVNKKPERIVYVSCNANTLLRDLKVLAKSYKTEVLRALDMFPFTQHLEVMILLERLNK